MPDDVDCNYDKVYQKKTHPTKVVVIICGNMEENICTLKWYKSR